MHLETFTSSNANSEFDAQVQAKSLRTVILYNLAETFDLVDEEIIWARHQFEEIVELLSNYQAVSPTLSMITEIRNGAYSNLLSIRTKAHVPRGNVTQPNKGNKQPTLENWVDALVQPVEMAYPQLSSNETIQIRSAISYILRNIGVGDVSSPRGCTRLPVELKLLLAESEFITSN
jgi:hypothetical protein